MRAWRIATAGKAAARVNGKEGGDKSAVHAVAPELHADPRLPGNPSTTMAGMW
jgi:hypothetical protein